MTIRLVLPEIQGLPFRLGRHVRHDPESWNYRLRGDGTAHTVQWPREIGVLDQGDLGSCTGNAGTGLLGSDPFVNTLPNGVFNSLNENYAVQLYSDATKLDSDPQNYPPTDTGSDGLSIAKVLKARGLISGYQHAFFVSDAMTAIQSGPLLVGTVWTKSMFTPDSHGVIKATGVVQGGHEYECVGYDTETDLWHFVNSWGSSWGVNGHFYYSTATFAQLLAQEGDIVAPVPTSLPAPTPTPAPMASAADTALNQALPAGWSTARHTGANKTAAVAVAQWQRATFGSTR